MHAVTERKESSAKMTHTQESQLQAHEAWRVMHLAALERDRSEVVSHSPEFKGSWNEASLSGRDLRYADFRQVKPMSRAKFDGADLRGARLDKVDLSGASFKGARLNGATFRNADLRDADLGDAQGLSCENLAGADLRGAILPKDVSEFKGLEAVSEASSYLQGSFKLVFALCGFSALTILSMKDENLILHNGQFTTQLPILQAVVSPLMFAYMAPLVILILYTYQVFYSLSLWRLLSFLPAYFPDGMPLDRRAHPMLINTFVRVELERLKQERHDNFQYVARGLIAFASPPLTLTVFWISCLKMHDPILSGVQSAFVACCSFLFLFVMTLAGGILRGELQGEPIDVLNWKSRPIHLRKLFSDRSSATIALLLMFYAATTFFIKQDFYELPICAVLLYLFIKNYFFNIRNCNYLSAAVNWVFVGLINFLLCFTLSFICFGAQNDSLKVIQLVETPNKNLSLNTLVDYPKKRHWSLFPHVLRQLNYYPFLDLRGRVVSRRPESWTGQPEKEGDEMLAVSGADLEGADLRSMDAERAFLAKANLRRAKLQDAYLRFANLREADMTDAQCDGTYLRGANLREANLQGADLSGAIYSADFCDPTTRIGPNFQEAKINEKTKLDYDKIISERVNNFSLAYFGVYDMEEWKFNKELTGKKRIKNDFLQQLKRIGIPARTDKDLGQRTLRKLSFDGSAMSGADLRDFDLQGSTFRCTRHDKERDPEKLNRDSDMDLTGALFSGANLTDVDFTGADLTGADFSRANLKGANFRCANLSGAKFKESNWRDAINIDGKVYSFLEFLEPKRPKP